MRVEISLPPSKKRAHTHDDGSGVDVDARQKSGALMVFAVLLVVMAAVGSVQRYRKRPH